MGCKDEMARTEKSRPRTRTKWQGRKKCRPRTKSDARTKWQIGLGQKDGITWTVSSYRPEEIPIRVNHAYGSGNESYKDKSRIWARKSPIRANHAYGPGKKSYEADVLKNWPKDEKESSWDERTKWKDGRTKWARTKKSRPRTKSDTRTKLQGRKEVVLGRDEDEMGFSVI